MKKILLTAGFTLFAWGSTCLAQSTYFSDSKEWLRKAEACKPELSYQTISPVKVVRSVQDTKAFQGWRMEDAGQPDILFNEPFKKHPAITLDFGNHYTGYLTFSIKPSGLKAADAPVRLKFTFAEVPGELNTPLEPYKGRTLPENRTAGHIGQFRLRVRQADLQDTNLRHQRSTGFSLYHRSSGPGYI